MANSWVAEAKARACYFLGSLHNPQGFAYEFTANNDGSIDDSVLIFKSGLLLSIDIYFDDDVPPNSLTLVVKRKSGSTMLISNSAIIVSTEDIKPDNGLPFIPVTDGFYLTASGNTTPNAKGIVVLNFMV